MKPMGPFSTTIGSIPTPELLVGGGEVYIEPQERSPVGPPWAMLYELM